MHTVPDASKSLARVLVSGLSGGGGKTLLSLGLARLLRRKRFALQVFKKGPDYIDSAWLSLASGASATNLDPFFLKPSELTWLFCARCAPLLNAEKSLALIEGNRGLFDGVDCEGSASTAFLARLLKAPILLTIPCSKMTRTAAAVIEGVCHFEPKLTFLGVVLNQVGTSRQEALLRTVIEQYTDQVVLGVLPRLRENLLPERHMGLASKGADLALDAEERIERIADFVLQHVDVETLLARSQSKAEPLPKVETQPLKTAISVESSVRIGYALDRAFWFYYAENLQALEDEGATLVPIDLFSEGLSEQLSTLHGLYLGGGFPEDFAKEIAASSMHTALRSLADKNLPIYAECGGFMLLARSLTVHGITYPMAGVFSLDVEFCSKPQGLGYTEAKVCGENPYFPKGLNFRGHEFHYSQCVLKEQPAFILELERGSGMGGDAQKRYDGLLKNQVFAAYTHIFAPAVPCWAQNFVRACADFAQM